MKVSSSRLDSRAFGVMIQARMPERLAGALTNCACDGNWARNGNRRRCQSSTIVHRS